MKLKIKYIIILIIMNTLEINNEQYDDNYPIELLIRRYTTYREQYIELKLINEICGISIR
jgi:hypothetical protein